MNGTMPKVYLVRHGETAWTISGQYTSRTDIPLNEQGESYAQKLSARLRGLAFVKVLTSPLQRARQASELAGFGECVQTDPDLTEWDYDTYEGRRTSDIQAKYPSWRLFEDGCPDGELVEVSRRAVRVIARIRASESDVLVFSHRDISRILAVRCVALPASLYLETASLM